MPFREWPEAVVWLAALLAGAMLVDAARRADWQAPARDHLAWATLTALVWVARHMAVTLPGGLTVQYLGAAWLTLLLGYPRAVVSMTIVFAAEWLEAGDGLPAATGSAASGASAVDASGPAGLASLALPLLLLGILPAWLIWALAAFCRRRLPANPFVFLLGVGFLGLFAAHALPLLLAAGLTALLGGPTAPDYWQTMLPYALLLASGEAWLEGMITTLLVVFAPGAVRLFDERFYLRRPQDPPG